LRFKPENLETRFCELNSQRPVAIAKFWILFESLTGAPFHGWIYHLRVNNLIVGGLVLSSTELEYLFLWKLTMLRSSLLSINVFCPRPSVRGSQWTSSSFIPTEKQGLPSEAGQPGAKLYWEMEPSWKHDKIRCSMTQDNRRRGIYIGAFQQQ